MLFTTPMPSLTLQPAAGWRVRIGTGPPFAEVRHELEDVLALPLGVELLGGQGQVPGTCLNQKDMVPTKTESMDKQPTAQRINTHSQTKKGIPPKKYRLKCSLNLIVDTKLGITANATYCCRHRIICLQLKEGKGNWKEKWNWGKSSFFQLAMVKISFIIRE